MRSVWAYERRMVRKDMVRRMRYGVAMGMAGMAAMVGLALASGPGATAEEYGSSYAMDEPASTSFYGDDNPGLNYGYADEMVWMQESFPCQEDEVLTYHPSFGPDRVGCLHYEAIADESIR